MIGYVNYVDQQRKDEKEHNPEPAVMNFERGPGDLPLLPVEVKGVRGTEIAKNAQEIIRAYFLRHYCKITRFSSNGLLTTFCQSSLPDAEAQELPGH